jgi:hypothetical protein
VKSKNQFLDVAILDLNLLEGDSDSVSLQVALGLMEATTSCCAGHHFVNANAVDTGLGELRAGLEINTRTPISTDSEAMGLQTKWLLMYYQALKGIQVVGLSKAGFDPIRA